MRTIVIFHALAFILMFANETYSKQICQSDSISANENPTTVVGEQPTSNGTVNIQPTAPRKEQLLIVRPKSEQSSPNVNNDNKGNIEKNKQTTSAKTEDDGWNTKSKKAKTKKKKPFYDVKSQLIGVSGDVDTLVMRGFSGKLFLNDVTIDKSILPHLTEAQKKKGWSKEQIDTIQKRLNEMRIGHQVLAYLFPYKMGENGNVCLSDEVMNQRALLNAQYVDIEKANVASNDITSILRDDWLPLLKNNYIYLDMPVNEFSEYIVFKVEITDEIWAEILNNWENPEGFEAINPEVKYVYSDREKFKNPQKFQRKLSENVPAFAIRGQLTGRNPATAHIGSQNGLKKMDVVTIYRQSMDKDGEMVSNRISRARVNSLDEENCQMTFISGTRGSYKDGDMVVLTPDKKQGIGIYGNYSTGNFFGASLIWDDMLHISKAGFSGKLLGQVKFDYADYAKKNIYNTLLEELDIYINPPFILDGSVGYGLSWNFLGRIELMPYATVGCEFVLSPGKYFSIGSHDYKYPNLAALGIRGSAGLRFDLNIAYPLKLSLGAEYGYVYGLDMSKQNTSSSYKDTGTLWVDYEFFKELFKLNGEYLKKLNRNSINFYVGLRYVF